MQTNVKGMSVLNKTNWLVAGALVLVFGVGTLLGFLVSGGPKFGFVDSARVWADSELGSQYREAVRAKEQDLNERFAKLTNEEKAKRRDEFVAERNKLESELVSKFQVSLNKAVRELGKKHRLDAIFSASVMPYGKLDLTEEATKALKKE